MDRASQTPGFGKMSQCTQIVESARPPTTDDVDRRKKIRSPGTRLPASGRFTSSGRPSSRHFAAQHGQVQPSQTQTPSEQHSQPSAQSQAQTSPQFGHPLQQPPARFAGCVASAKVVVDDSNTSAETSPLTDRFAASLWEQHEPKDGETFADAAVQQAQTQLSQAQLSPRQQAQPSEQLQGQSSPHNGQPAQHEAAVADRLGVAADITSPTADKAVIDKNRANLESMAFLPKKRVSS